MQVSLSVHNNTVQCIVEQVQHNIWVLPTLNAKQVDSFHLDNEWKSSICVVVHTYEYTLVNEDESQLGSLKQVDHQPV